MSENVQFEKDEYYLIRFVDHNLKTCYDNDLEEIYFTFIGKYLGSTERVDNFYLAECSDDKHSDVFQVVKGSTMIVKKLNINQ
jgi:hypothetical protein